MFLISLNTNLIDMRQAKIIARIATTSNIGSDSNKAREKLCQYDNIIPPSLNSREKNWTNPEFERLIHNEFRVGIKATIEKTATTVKIMILRLMAINFFSVLMRFIILLKRSADGVGDAKQLFIVFKSCSIFINTKKSANWCTFLFFYPNLLKFNRTKYPLTPVSPFCACF